KCDGADFVPFHRWTSHRYNGSPPRPRLTPRGDHARGPANRISPDLLSPDLSVDRLLHVRSDPGGIGATRRAGPGPSLAGRDGADPGGAGHGSEGLRWGAARR